MRQTAKGGQLLDDAIRRLNPLDFADKVDDMGSTVTRAVAMERTAALAPENAEVLYDLAVIRLAAGDRPGALEALSKSIVLNPAIANQAAEDAALGSLRTDSVFQALTR